tara:strand:- start:99 stop:1064 length:966 start_codon:yes stop_codon:yes gene_type:complete
MLNIPADMPDYAQIAITNICNLDCGMCFKHFLKLDIKHMDFDIFRKVVNKLEGISTLALTGYGEPLMHPQFFEAVRYVKEKEFDVQTTSNGLLLNTGSRIKELISSGLDSISFSLESIHEGNGITHSNTATLKNIQRLVESKRTLNSALPSITLQTLMLKNREQDLFDIIKWGAANGVDRINVARFEINTLQDVERPDIYEEKKIFKEFERLRRKHHIRIDCLQDQIYTRIKGYLYKYFKHFLGMDRRCIRLYDFIYVNVDGFVNPCCAIVETRVGNLCEENLRDIWKSKKFDLFRKNYRQYPWCEKCDFAKLSQVDVRNQ